MEVSNSSGVVTDYNVKGVGGGAAPSTSKGGPRKATAALKCGKLHPKTFCRLTPPPGKFWLVQFVQGGTVIAEEKVEDSGALVVLVQESDGTFKVHVARSSSAARSSNAGRKATAA